MGQSPMMTAPTANATAANQLVVAGNACGPTALLNAFRFGNDSWHRATTTLTGSSDRQLIGQIIRNYGMRPSNHIKSRPRWSRKGVNLADLTDIANEMTRGQYLPQLSQEILFRRPRESPEDLLRRAHQRMVVSLKKGLPPLVSLRRYANRRAANSNAMNWVILDAHFVTLISLPAKLDRGANAFAVKYIDPWGGEISDGQIRISGRPVLASQTALTPCLEADFPAAQVGRKLVRPGETHALTIAAALGRW